MVRRLVRPGGVWHPPRRGQSHAGAECRGRRRSRRAGDGRRAVGTTSTGPTGRGVRSSVGPGECRQRPWAGPCRTRPETGRSSWLGGHEHFRLTRVRPVRADDLRTLSPADSRRAGRRPGGGPDAPPPTRAPRDESDGRPLSSLSRPGSRPVHQRGASRAVRHRRGAPRRRPARRLPRLDPWHRPPRDRRADERPRTSAAVRSVGSRHRDGRLSGTRTVTRARTGPEQAHRRTPGDLSRQARHGGRRGQSPAGRRAGQSRPCRTRGGRHTPGRATGDGRRPRSPGGESGTRPPRQHDGVDVSPPVSGVTTLALGAVTAPVRQRLANGAVVTVA